MAASRGDEGGRAAKVGGTSRRRHVAAAATAAAKPAVATASTPPAVAASTPERAPPACPELARSRGARRLLRSREQGRGSPQQLCRLCRAQEDYDNCIWQERRMGSCSDVGLGRAHSLAGSQFVVCICRVVITTLPFTRRLVGRAQSPLSCPHLPALCRSAKCSRAFSSMRELCLGTQQKYESWHPHRAPPRRGKQRPPRPTLGPTQLRRLTCRRYHLSCLFALAVAVVAARSSSTMVRALSLPWVQGCFARRTSGAPALRRAESWGRAAAAALAAGASRRPGGAAGKRRHAAPASAAAGARNCCETCYLC